MFFPPATLPLVPTSPFFLTNILLEVSTLASFHLICPLISFQFSPSLNLLKLISLEMIHYLPNQYTLWPSLFPFFIFSTSPFHISGDQSPILTPLPLKTSTSCARLRRLSCWSSGNNVRHFKGSDKGGAHPYARVSSLVKRRNKRDCIEECRLGWPCATQALLHVELFAE